MNKRQTSVRFGLAVGMIVTILSHTSAQSTTLGLNRTASAAIKTYTTFVDGSAEVSLEGITSVCSSSGGGTFYVDPSRAGAALLVEMLHAAYVSKSNTQISYNCLDNERSEARTVQVFR